MALQLLDGTDASVDLSLAGNSLRCIINAMEYRSVRGFQDATTLCSGKWVSELPGRNQDFITVTRFASKGTTISDLSAFMTSTAAAAVVFTLGAGVTKTGTFWMDSESNAVSAGSVAIPGNVTLRSYGSVATAGVTS